MSDPRRWTLYDTSEDFNPRWKVGDGTPPAANGYAEEVVVMPVAEAREAIAKAAEHLAAFVDDQTGEIADVARLAVEINQREVERIAAEVKALRAALWECAQLSGADLSGHDGPQFVTDLPALAVEGVRELRATYDEHEELERAERAEAKLARVVTAGNELSDACQALYENATSQRWERAYEARAAWKQAAR